MENTQEEIKKITLRNASSFGFQLANNLGERLEKDNILPSEWPAKIPITIKQITKLPEIRSAKIAKRVAEAARAAWKDMREQAIEIERDMRLHPEYYTELAEVPGFSQEIHGKDWAWRHLSIELEQVAGSVFVTQYEDEESAKAHVYKFVSAPSLRQFMIDFEDDFKNFIHEVREAIRAKKEILPSIRLDLICILNVNMKAAAKPKKK